MIRSSAAMLEPPEMDRPLGRPGASSAGPQLHPGDWRRHPLSRWYLCPLVDWVARQLAPSSIRPLHVTLAGAVAALAAATLLLSDPWSTIPPAIAVWAAWFCDRLDGALARRQGTATLRGAWVDANLDELIDVGLQAAVAAAAFARSPTPLPWVLWGAMVSGKYLMLHARSGGLAATGNAGPMGTSLLSPAWTNLRSLYHLPGNSDLRLHLLLAALASGWLTAELLLVAIYYNVCWLVSSARRLQSLEVA